MAMARGLALAAMAEAYANRLAQLGFVQEALDFCAALPRPEDLPGGAGRGDEAAATLRVEPVVDEPTSDG